jgi:hypothetical protein
MVAWHVAINRTDWIPFDHHHLSDSSPRFQSLYLLLDSITLLLPRVSSSSGYTLAVVDGSATSTSIGISFPYDSRRVMDDDSGDVGSELLGDYSGWETSAGVV